MRQPKPWRMARGTFLQAGAGGTQSTVSLYNDGTGAELLALWFIISNVAGATHLLQSWQVAGTVGTKQNKGVPIWGNATALPGAIYGGNLASLPTNDLYIPGQGAGGFGGYLFPTPIAIIDPGWTFATGSYDVNAAVWTSFVWEAVHPEDVYGQPCHICDRTPTAPVTSA